MSQAQPAASGKAVCVFCASSSRIDRKFVDLAAEVGAELARRGYSLVSGGGQVSCMGAVARAARAGGARTVGVIPEGLAGLELADHDSDELVVTPDMRSRKGEMDRRSDAFLVLPGGIGTLEELVEQMTWAQLGAHNRPVLLVNTLGFWDPFLQLLEHMRREAFLRSGLDASCIVAATPEEALTLLLEAARNPGAPPQSSPERPAAPGPF